MADRIGGQRRFNIDADIENADWLRRRWALPLDASRFLEIIGGPEALAEFMTLPAARNMPAELRAELVRRRLIGPD